MKRTWWARRSREGWKRRWQQARRDTKLFILNQMED